MSMCQLMTYKFIKSIINNLINISDQYYDSPAGLEGDDLPAAATSDYTIPYIDHSQEDLSHH